MLNDEIKDTLPFLQILRTQDAPAGKTIEHFTQVNWAASYLVGCGYSAYVENGFSNTLYVCQYAPGGNILGTPFYQVAATEADRQCPAVTSPSESTSMAGLCCLFNMCTYNN